MKLLPGMQPASLEEIKRRFHQSASISVMEKKSNKMNECSSGLSAPIHYIAALEFSLSLQVKKELINTISAFH